MLKINKAPADVTIRVPEPVNTALSQFAGM
jgi:hypothetical protein